MSPGLRHYHAAYYGAFLRDLDGNKVEAVCHRAMASETAFSQINSGFHSRHAPCGTSVDMSMISNKGQHWPHRDPIRPPGRRFKSFRFPRAAQARRRFASVRTVISEPSKRAC